MTATVRTESAAVARMSRHWPMIRTLMGGTAAMRDAGKRYLPKWPNEDEESYKARLESATLYPAFRRTIEVMGGKPFSKALTLGEDTPPRIVQWMDDCDMQGNNLHAFASDILADLLALGVSGVLVDYPRVDGVRTVADERQAGARPYFTRYAPGTVLGWRTERRGGATRLTQLRLLETVEEDDGEFGIAEVEQVRVLTPGAWQIWRKEKEDWGLYEEGTTTLPEVPFVFFCARKVGFGESEIPLLDLAYQNIEHWQSSSDQQTILHVARVPILALIGADEAEITVGAKSAVKLPVGGDMKFVEHSGAAIGAGKESLADLEERMRATGAELLVLKPGQITATQVTSESEANKSTLQRIVENMEDGLDQCLQFAADWVKEPQGGSVQIFKDFGAATLAEASAQLLLQANQAGKISDETFFGELQRRGIVAPDVTFDDERERIEGQGPALGRIESKQ